MTETIPVVYDEAQYCDWSDHDEYSPVGEVIGESYDTKVRLTATRYVATGCYTDPHAGLVSLEAIHKGAERIEIEIYAGEDLRGNTQWKIPNNEVDLRSALTTLARQVARLTPERDWSE